MREDFPPAKRISGKLATEFSKGSAFARFHRIFPVPPGLEAAG